MSKTFLVTGCAKGIGLAISYHLDTLGYQVVGIARKAPDNNLFKGSFYIYSKNSSEEQAILSTIPMKRMGQPEEVAYAVAFFLNAQASFITGQTLFVDGGSSVGISNY